MLVSQLEFIRQIRPHGADTPVGDATPTDTEGGKMTNKNLRGEQKKKDEQKRKGKKSISSSIFSKVRGAIE